MITAPDRGHRSEAFVTGLATGVYLLVIALSVWLRGEQAGFMPIWLPTALAVLILLRRGCRSLLWLAPACAATVFATLSSLGVGFAEASFSAIALAGLDVGSGALFVCMLRRLGIRTPSFSRPDEVVRVTGVAILATGLAGLVGLVLQQVLPGRWNPAVFGASWWLAAASGLMVGVPFLVAWSGRWSWPRGVRACLEPAGYWSAVAALAAGMVLTWQTRAPVGVACAFLVVPVLVWAGLRLGGRVATASVVLIAGAAILAGHGYGVVAPTDIPLAVVLVAIQVYLITLSFLALAVTSAVSASAQALRQVSDRARLTEELQTYTEQVRTLSAEFALAEERERKRLAAELHDTIVQDLGVLKFRLQETLAEEEVSAELRERFAGSLSTLAEVIEQARSLMFRISPPVLYEVGLAAALDWLCEQTEALSGIHCELVVEGEKPSLSDDRQILLFQIARELLNNARRHARPQSIDVRLVSGADRVALTVCDDGVGFDPEAVYPASEHRFGLFSVRDRVDLAGGRVTIDSSPGAGTRVCVEVPCDAAAPGARPGP